MCRNNWKCGVVQICVCICTPWRHPSNQLLLNRCVILKRYVRNCSPWLQMGLAHLLLITWISCLNQHGGIMHQTVVNSSFISVGLFCRRSSILMGAAVHDLTIYCNSYAAIQRRYNFSYTESIPEKTATNDLIQHWRPWVFIKFVWCIQQPTSCKFWSDTSEHRSATVQPLIGYLMYFLVLICALIENFSFSSLFVYLSVCLFVFF